MTMKVLFAAFLMMTTLVSFGQTPNEARVVPPLRQQIFGVSNVAYDLPKYEFDTSGLVFFGNGFLITQEEFLLAFYEIPRSDSSQAAQNKFLDEYILKLQKIFEAMDQDLDTSTTFQLNFLKYKQDMITPWLNEGYSRLDAEARPEVKFALRQYYGDQLLRVLNQKEIWSKDTDENLQEFYNDHLALYQGQSFATSKTKVVHDLNKKLETDLNERVNGKFPFVVNPKHPR